MKSNRTSPYRQDDRCSDASIVVPPHRSKPIDGFGSRSVARHVSLENLPLRDVVNDTRSRGFCGPTAVASIVGQPISLVRDAFRRARYGAGWVNFRRAPAITGTTHAEVQWALEMFGFTGHWQAIPDKPTLAAFLEERTGKMRTHPCIVEVTHHWVAVCGWQFCDTFSKGRVVEADEAPRRRKRVKKVFLITGHAHRAWTIPRKDYSAAKTRAAAGQKTRSAYTRFLATMDARHELDRDDPSSPTITVTFADGKRIGMHFDDWEQALGDLKHCLENPEDEEIEEIEDGFHWYGF